MGRLSNVVAAGTILAGGPFVDVGMSPDPDIPDRAFTAYYTAAQNAPCSLDWRFLAAVGRTESGHGASQGGRIRDDGLIVDAAGNELTIGSPAGAQGPMQFMAPTWGQYGAGNINDIDDAAAASARLLCASNIDVDPVDALGSYNGGGNWEGYAESRQYVELTTTYAANLPALPGSVVAPHALSEAKRIDDGSLGSKAAIVADETLKRWHQVGELTASTPFLAEAWGTLDKLLGGAGGGQAQPVTADGKALPPVAASSGGFAQPCDGPVTSDFGPRSAPTAGASSQHKGLDMGCGFGSPARAAASGRVTEVVHGHAGYGNYVVIDHGAGIGSSYSHLESTSVKVGDTVRQGQQVGAVGSTGVSTGPHLHFEMTRDGVPFDPAEMLP
jgi:murein DD-endopeptidase MepM/ murein hydrolase activator NlpD